MSEERLALGRWGEEQAVDHLRRCGMKILERNYRVPVGEIDIVARDRKQLVFVEVKARRSTRFGTPQEAVGLRKQRQIIRAAQWYLADHRADKLQPRFDVIAVMPGSDGTARIEHLRDAFTLDFLNR
ncbi:MAG TPA: YraN family protein [Geopsychrobacteraceae bacterium]